jgi:hypothetical protein
MEVLAIALLIWAFGVLLTCFYAYEHRTDFDVDGTLTFLVTLVILFWFLVLLFDFVLYGRLAWSSFKDRLSH